MAALTLQAAGVRVVWEADGAFDFGAMQPYKRGFDHCDRFPDKNPSSALPRPVLEARSQGQSAGAGVNALPRGPQVFGDET